MSQLLLTRQSTQTGHGPGKILSYHRATKYVARLGQAPTPFDDVAYAFMGDAHNGLAPATVILEDHYFNNANQTQVPTVANLVHLLGNDPTLELVGPFASGDADTEPVTVRKISYVPPKYMLLAFDAPLSPRQLLHEQELLRSVRRRIFSSLQSCLFQTELLRIEHVVFNPKNCSFGPLSASLRQRTNFQALLVQRAVLIQAMEPELIAFLIIVGSDLSRIIAKLKIN